MEGNRANSLWSAPFAKICVANFALCVSFYTLIPQLWKRAAETGGGAMLCGMVLAAFSFGMILLGPFYSRWVEAYSRKRIFLRAALLSGAVVWSYSMPLVQWQAAGFALVQGMLFGVAQMALGGTLVNDLLPSELRTAGDNLYMWSGRMAWPAGWMAGLWLSAHVPFQYGLGVAAACCVAAWLLIVPLRVPLKAPVSVPRFSLDRFWQTEAWPLSVSALLVSVPAGMLMATGPSLRLCALLGVGLAAGCWSQQVAFRDADERAGVVAGAIFSAMGLLLWHFRGEAGAMSGFALLGLGLGLSSARLLMFFLRLSGHCRRGTAQNTFLLSWHIGFAAGFLLAAFGLPPFAAGISLSAALLLYYLLFMHRWYTRYRKARAEADSDSPFCAT